jgi:hypothetical protein
VVVIILERRKSKRERYKTYRESGENIMKAKVPKSYKYLPHAKFQKCPSP